MGADFEDPRALPEVVCEALQLSQEALDGLEVDLRSFYGLHGEKLGLGSSAASTVALVRALRPDLGRAEVGEVALIAHRRFQGGHGSGADVMACAHEAPLVFRVEEVDPAFEQISLRRDPRGPAVEEVALPEGLQAWGIWTGAPASTTSFMRPVRAKAKADPAEVRRHFEGIAAISAAGVQACQEDDAGEFLRALERGDEAMEALGALCDLTIVTETHRRLREAAVAAGFVAKPSGAGGGDFSLLVGPEGQDLPPFANSFLRVPLRLR